MKFAFILAIFLANIGSDAGAAGNFFLNSTEFTRLPRDEKVQYIKTLRAAIKDFGKFHKGKYSWLKGLPLALFVETAQADPGSIVCIYAGWPSTVLSGKCLTPEQAKCGDPGQIRCNPVLYGEAGCVGKGVRASAACEANSDSIEIIVDGLEGNPAPLNEFKSAFDKSCGSGGHQAGKSVCALWKAKYEKVFTAFRQKAASSELESGGEQPKEVQQLDETEKEAPDECKWVRLNLVRLRELVSCGGKEFRFLCEGDFECTKSKAPAERVFGAYCLSENKECELQACKANQSLDVEDLLDQGKSSTGDTTGNH